MKKVIFALLFIMALVAVPYAAKPVEAQVLRTCPPGSTSLECMRDNAEQANREIGLAGNDKPLQVVIIDFIRISLRLLGVVFMVLIMYAGFMWMTSAGSDEKITKAKKILTSAVIGLFIVVISYAISTWVLNSILEASGQYPYPTWSPL